MNCDQNKFSKKMDVEVIVPQIYRPEVNISFRDLNYSVLCGKEEKCILKKINGEFRTGKISAILGPSGSGKTTLINILAGYIVNNFSGLVLTNNQSRVLRHFHKMSRYIMQENALQPYLTVFESMMIAADFKFDNRVLKQAKIHVVTNILNTLRLANVKNNMTNKLSGGERKRLAIALELINNPSVIFLDEPTSGLDEQASFQCVSTLKQLAQEGKTVICSIHAPSAKTFALFDHVYIMTEGQCVYQGEGDQILSFLKRIQLTCPVSYNPTDFFIDVACGEYGQQLQKLVDLTENGKLCYPSKIQTDNCDLTEDETKNLCLENIPEYNTSTISQLRILLYRKFTQTCRNHTAFKTKFSLLAVTITIYSTMYYGFGNDATKFFSNLTYLYISILGLLFGACMPPLIHFPIEFRLIQSEYFNRWYNISAYFLATSLAVIPDYVISTILYVGISYPLTDQPIGFDKMVKFMAVCVLVNLISNASSMAVASILSDVNALFGGIVVLMPPFILAFFGVGYSFYLNPLIVQFMIRTSFLRYALEALMEVVYTDRPQDLLCPDSELLCVFTSPKVIPKIMGYGTMNYWTCVAALVAFYVLSKYGHYFLLKQRLRPGKPAKIARLIVGCCKNLLIKYLP